MKFYDFDIVGNINFISEDKIAEIMNYVDDDIYEYYENHKYPYPIDFYIRLDESLKTNKRFNYSK